MECQARAFKSPARYILSSPLPVWIYLTVQSRRRRFQKEKERRKGVGENKKMEEFFVSVFDR
jgi:hypothetical protein